MFLGAVRLHLEMSTKFPPPRTPFHRKNGKKTAPAQSATVRCPAAPAKPLLRSVEAGLRTAPTTAQTPIAVLTLQNGIPSAPASPPPSRDAGTQNPGPISPALSSLPENSPAPQTAIGTQSDPPTGKPSAPGE